MKRFPLGLAAHFLAAFLGAALFVGVVDLVTGTMPPRWDGLTYVSMAEKGIVRNPDLIAPFAYRPGMPFLAGALSRILRIPVEDGFRMVGFASAVLLLVLVYGMARTFVQNASGAAFVAGVVGLSATHVKFPLYYATLVDVAAYPLLVAGIWAGLRRRYGLALVISLLGLLFKEFLIIPIVLLLMRAAGNSEMDPGRKRRILAAGVILGPLIFFLPRLLIRVSGTFQELDPFHDPESLRRFVSNPLDWKREVNIGFSLAGYWLPTLLLATPARLRSVWIRLQGIRAWLAVYLGMVFLLTMYGGTNIFIFVSYSVAAQVVVLAYLWREGISRTEVLAVLLALFVYNRISWAIPDPGVDFDAYLDFYGGWASRLPRESGWRVVEMTGYLALMFLVRRIPGGKGEGGKGSRPFADPRRRGDVPGSR